MKIDDLMLAVKIQQANAALAIGNDNNTDSEDSGLTSFPFAMLLQDAMQSEAGSEVPASQSEVNQLPAASRPGDFNQIIALCGQKYGVDPKLIREVINAESSFNPNSVSKAGAQGLMQLMPETAASYGVKNPFDPAQNIDAGTHFLKDLLDRYGHNVSLALAAYNAGPGAVQKYKGIPPYKETQNYVNKIMGALNSLDEKA